MSTSPTREGFTSTFPFIGSTYRSAAAILASFSHTVEDLPRDARDRVIDFPEVGFDPDLPKIAKVQRRDPSQPVTFVFAGRFVPLKLVDVAVQAFAETPALRKHRLVLIGDGMERAAIEEQIARNDLNGVVELVGWKSIDEVGEILGQSDVFVFPSIRDLGAGVVIQAMGAGCAPIVVDYGGPGGLVAEDAGIKIPLADRKKLVTDLAEACVRYVNDRELLYQHATRAQANAREHYTWEAKAKKTVEVYEWVSGRRAVKPQFGRHQENP